MIFAQGIGPLNSKISKILVRFLLKRADYVSVRDEKSHRLMKKYKINAQLVCDPIYSISTPKANKTGKIGVQLRDFHTMNETLLDNLAKQIVIEFSDKTIEILSFQNSLDLEVCKKFADKLKILNPDIDTIVLPSSPLKETIERLAGLEYLVAMRFHAILVALMAGVPTCAINYDIKVEKIANEAKIPLLAMDANQDFESVFNELQNLDSKELLKYAQSKKFDWNDFEKVYTSK